MSNSRIKINEEEKSEYSGYDELISKILIYLKTELHFRTTGLLNTD